MRGASTEHPQESSTAGLLRVPNAVGTAVSLHLVDVSVLGSGGGTGGGGSSASTRAMSASPGTVPALAA